METFASAGNLKRKYRIATNTNNHDPPPHINIKLKKIKKNNMNILLGNLSVSEIEKRIGINFPDEIRDFMNENNQQEASNIKNGKWHCFDMPFILVCGDIETATKIYNSVKEKSAECKELLRISIQS